MSSATTTQPLWRRSTLAIALVGSLLLWAALPPLSLAWLAWIAPVPWLLLARADVLPGCRPYRALWLAGLAFWLLALHWLRLPHPALYLGWLALSAYLALYLPAFVGLSRVAVHRIGVPLWLAAPVVFTGLELARAHLLTGFLMGSLAHTQVHWTALIQVSDLFGEYGVDFVIMLVASCIASVLPLARFISSQRAGASARLSASKASPPRAASASRSMFTLLAKLAPAAIVLAATLLYGHHRLNESQTATADAPSTIRIALIQGNSPADWKFDVNRERQIMDEYLELSGRAVEMAKRDGRPIDLLIWPETMFRTPLITIEPGFRLPPESRRTPAEIAAYGPQDLASLVARVGTPVLAGIDRIDYRAAPAPEADQPPPRRYNAAVLVERDGKIVGTYDKIHRVMFGEYIPFAERLPFLYNLTPLTGGINAGVEPAVFELNDRFYAPSICYETVIPHVIRRQANTLVGGSVPADVLINVTNDAWYWGSSELDLHLACGVFRAVETRTPLVIAANGGISAWIDRFGRVRAKSPKQKPDVIVADVELGRTSSWYLQLGDVFAGVCLTCCIVLAIIGWINCRMPKFPAPSP